MSTASVESNVKVENQSTKNLENSTVIIFGIGGVGSYTAEALARCGVGKIVIVDDDKVCLTNVNRQLIAVRSTVGKDKVNVMRDRILDINPNIEVTIHQSFFGPDNADEFDYSTYDYIVDAIDTISSKLILVEKAEEFGVPIISCMGAGNKLDGTRFEVADIYETSDCPLARVMRVELRKRSIDKLKVVYSKEKALTPIESKKNSCKYNCVCPSGTKRKCTVRRQVPGSVSFVPSVAGIVLASEVVKDLIQ